MQMLDAVSRSPPFKLLNNYSSYIAWRFFESTEIDVLLLRNFLEACGPTFSWCIHWKLLHHLPRLLLQILPEEVLEETFPKAQYWLGSFETLKFHLSRSCAFDLASLFRSVLTCPDCIYDRIGLFVWHSIFLRLSFTRGWKCNESGASTLAATRSEAVLQAGTEWDRAKSPVFQLSFLVVHPSLKVS